MLHIRSRTICCHILEQVGDRIPLGLERHGAPRRAGGELRIDTGRMIDKIGVEAALFDLFGRQVAGELVHNSGDHLHVRQLLCTCGGVEMTPAGFDSPRPVAL